MTISIQLIETPKQESVNQRIINFPSTGGSIGRSYECTLQLPDTSKSISRIHAVILSDSDGFKIVDKSTNGMQINNKRVLSEYPTSLNDGDLIKISGYTLLVSNLGQPSVNSADADPLSEREKTFSVDLSDQDDTRFLDSEATSWEPDNRGRNEFTAENVFNDDPFTEDPFNEIDLEPFKKKPTSKQPEVEPVEQQPEFIPVLSSDNKALEKKVDALIEMNKKSANGDIDHHALFQTIEQTLDQFLDEFSPEQLEEMFNDFVSGMFVRRKKRYWTLYKSNFNRRLKNKDFHRQFRSMFMENMSKGHNQ